MTTIAFSSFARLRAFGPNDPLQHLARDGDLAVHNAVIAERHVVELSQFARRDTVAPPDLPRRRDIRRNGGVRGRGR